MKKKGIDSYLKGASPEARKVSPMRQASNISPARTSAIQSYTRQSTGISPRKQNSIRLSGTANSPSRIAKQKSAQVQVLGTEPYRYGQTSSVTQSASNLATAGFPAELEEIFKREPNNNQILTVLHVPANFSKNI